MKNWIAAFVVGALLAGASPLVAEDIFRIEVGKSGRSSSDRELKFRVAQLELAVDQLQRKVFSLENDRSQAKPSPTWTTCYIKTPFDGTFSATEPTETAAKARALEKCSAKASSTFCAERELKCGQ